MGKFLFNDGAGVNRADGNANITCPPDFPFYFTATPALGFF
jgi:hypothetical protein